MASGLGSSSSPSRAEEEIVGLSLVLEAILSFTGESRSRSSGLAEGETSFSSLSVRML